MKSIADKVIAILIPGLVLSVWLATDISFEMYTEYKTWAYAPVTGIMSLVLVAYYGVRYIRQKKASFYFGSIVVFVFLWVCLQVTMKKINLLYAAAAGATTPTTLVINRVEKRHHKRSLTGSYVFIRLDTTQIKFRSSRINYFALKDKQEIRAVLGMTSDGNYYVSKIYWQAGEYSLARKAYWHYWIRRYWIVPVILLGILAVFFVGLPFRKKQGTRQAPKVWPTKALGMIYLKIMGIIALLFLAFYLATLIYIGLRYGTAP